MRRHGRARAPLLDASPPVIAHALQALLLQPGLEPLHRVAVPTVSPLGQELGHGEDGKRCFCSWSRPSYKGAIFELFFLLCLLTVDSVIVIWSYFYLSQNI